MKKVKPDAIAEALDWGDDETSGHGQRTGAGIMDWSGNNTRRDYMKTLIVVDMQNDFVDGALGTPEAVAILPAVKAKIAEYIDRGDEVIFTRDTHQEGYLQTNEGKHLPVEHCIEGSTGWEIAPGVYVDGCEIVDKPSFGYTGWTDRNFEEVELIGLCTDICVISNALIIKALYPEIPVRVDPKCCAGVTPESHEAALTTMKMCQVDMVD